MPQDREVWTFSSGCFWTQTLYVCFVTSQGSAQIRTWTRPAYCELLVNSVREEQIVFGIWRSVSNYSTSRVSGLQALGESLASAQVSYCNVYIPSFRSCFFAVFGFNVCSISVAQPSYCGHRNQFWWTGMCHSALQPVGLIAWVPPSFIPHFSYKANVITRPLLVRVHVALRLVVNRVWSFIEVRSPCRFTSVLLNVSGEFKTIPQYCKECGEEATASIE